MLSFTLFTTSSDVPFLTVVKAMKGMFNLIDKKPYQVLKHFLLTRHEGKKCLVVTTGMILIRLEIDDFLIEFYEDGKRLQTSPFDDPDSKVAMTFDLTSMSSKKVTFTQVDAGQYPNWEQVYISPSDDRLKDAEFTNLDTNAENMRELPFTMFVGLMGAHRVCVDPMVIYPLSRANADNVKMYQLLFTAKIFIENPWWSPVVVTIPLARSVANMIVMPIRLNK